MTGLYHEPGWCPTCEWGLQRFDGDRHRYVGWKWLDRRLYALAYRTAGSEFGRQQGAPPADGPTGTRIAVTAVAVALHLGVLACFVVGVWLCVHAFPSRTLIAGIPLVLIALLLRPRFRRLPRNVTTLRRREAPALHDLVHRVAAAVGAPVPQVIGIDGEYNAFAAAVGFRRRRALVLGLPLWGTLGPQERVALLGHELGHFVNGDVRRGLLTQPMYTMLPQVRVLLTPSRGAGGGGLAAWIGDAIFRMFAAVLRAVVFAAELALLWLAERDGQRAEYYADVLAARAGGTAAGVALMDSIYLDSEILLSVERAARRGDPVAAWQPGAARVIAEAAPTMAVRRQLSVRKEASLFASHPPTGFRARLLAGRPPVAPAVVLDPEASAAIDAELARHYQSCSRGLANR
jgi:heat shock protein HtpX